ncbi:MAG: PilZ domain-containing protein [Proteobacteria bacterium]|nr:PilZ domain-containing protein [Pseudomonadota bacterium]
MEKTEKMTDKRKHKRFQVEEAAFCVLSYQPTIMGQIVNISTEGLAAVYTGKRLKPSTEIDLFISDAGFYLEEIPVKTISDHKVSGKFLFSSKTKWQRSIQFEELTEDQKSDLSRFIKCYTSMIERSGKDRRQFEDPHYNGPERRSGLERRI